MNCTQSRTLSFNVTRDIFPYISGYIIIIGVFNISGNAILIWALKKTRQTNTISFQIIIIMSITDLAMSAGTILMLIIPYIPQQNNSRCWVTVLCQILLSTFSLYSFIMVALIALDRYLHMRYLERYPSILTKKRGYCLAVASFVYALTVNLIHGLPLPYNISYFSQSVTVFMVSFIVISVFVLYYKAIRAIRTKASQLTRSVIDQTRSLSKAAKRITFCYLILTLPLIIIYVLELINEHHQLIRTTALKSAKVIASVTFSSNAFWSSFIFISLNTRIRMLLRQLARGIFQSMTSPLHR